MSGKLPAKIKNKPTRKTGKRVPPALAKYHKDHPNSKYGPKGKGK
jgi:hypothetical protein